MEGEKSGCLGKLGVRIGACVETNHLRWQPLCCMHDPKACGNPKIFWLEAYLCEHGMHWTRRDDITYCGAAHEKPPPSVKINPERPAPQSVTRASRCAMLPALFHDARAVITGRSPAPSRRSGTAADYCHQRSPVEHHEPVEGLRRPLRGKSQHDRHHQAIRTWRVHLFDRRVRWGRIRTTGGVFGIPQHSCFKGELMLNNASYHASGKCFKMNL